MCQVSGIFTSSKFFYICTLIFSTAMQTNGIHFPWKSLVLDTPASLARQPFCFVMLDNLGAWHLGQGVDRNKSLGVLFQVWNLVFLKITGFKRLF